MKPSLTITDHAIVRYLERVGGFEIERLRADMARRIRPLLTEGLQAVIIDGHAYVVVNKDGGFVLVTVHPKGSLIRIKDGGVG